jgi:hypothetical protein
MKIAATALLLILAVIACGCTTQAPAATTAASPVQNPPDLTGTWIGGSVGYEPAIGFTSYGNTTMTMVVSEQKGRIFAGTFAFGNASNSETIAFSGVIGRDGKTLILPQATTGYSFGEIISPGEIELIYVADGMPYSSSIDTLKKA